MLKLWLFIFEDKDLYTKLNIDQHVSWILSLMNEHSGKEEDSVDDMKLVYIAEILSLFTTVFKTSRNHSDATYLKPEYRHDWHECLSEVFKIETAKVEKLLEWFKDPPSSFRDELGFSIYLSEDVYNIFDPEYFNQIQSFVEEVVEAVVVEPLEMLNKEQLFDTPLYVHFKVVPGAEKNTECLWMFVSEKPVDKNDFAV